MKTGFLFVLLLGFGFMTPKGCAHKQASEDKVQRPAKLRLPEQNRKQMALFAPVVLIKKGAYTS